LIPAPEQLNADEPLDGRDVAADTLPLAQILRPS